MTTMTRKHSSPPRRRRLQSRPHRHLRRVAVTCVGGCVVCDHCRSRTRICFMPLSCRGVPWCGALRWSRRRARCRWRCEGSLACCRDAPPFAPSSPQFFHAHDHDGMTPGCYVVCCVRRRLSQQHLRELADALGATSSDPADAAAPGESTPTVWRAPTESAPSALHPVECSSDPFPFDPLRCFRRTGDVAVETIRRGTRRPVAPLIPRGSRGCHRPSKRSSRLPSSRPWWCSCVRSPLATLTACSGRCPTPLAPPRPLAPPPPAPPPPQASSLRLPDRACILS